MPLAKTMLLAFEMICTDEQPKKRHFLVHLSRKTWHQLAACATWWKAGFAVAVDFWQFCWGIANQLSYHSFWALSSLLDSCQMASLCIAGGYRKLRAFVECCRHIATKHTEGAQPRAKLTRWLDADLTIKNGDLTIKWDILPGRISWKSLKVCSCVVI